MFPNIIHFSLHALVALIITTDAVTYTSYVPARLDGKKVDAKTIDLYLEYLESSGPQDPVDLDIVDGNLIKIRPPMTDLYTTEIIVDGAPLRMAIDLDPFSSYLFNNQFEKLEQVRPAANRYMNRLSPPQSRLNIVEGDTWDFEGIRQTAEIGLPDGTRGLQSFVSVSGARSADSKEAIKRGYLGKISGMLSFGPQRTKGDGFASIVAKGLKPLVTGLYFSPEGGRLTLGGPNYDCIAEGADGGSPHLVMISARNTQPVRGNALSGWHNKRWEVPLMSYNFGDDKYELEPNTWVFLSMRRRGSHGPLESVTKFYQRAFGACDYYDLTSGELVAEYAEGSVCTFRLPAAGIPQQVGFHFTEDASRSDISIDTDSLIAKLPGLEGDRYAGTIMPRKHFADYIFGLNILRSTYILFDNSGRDPLVGFAPVKPAAVNPCKQPPGNLATGKALTQLTSSV